MIRRHRRTPVDHPRPTTPVTVDVVVAHAGRVLASSTVTVTERASAVTLHLGDSWTMVHDALVWTPSRPTLLDAAVVVHGPDGATDEIASYLGMRDVTITGDALSLTGRPFYLRSVLEQGYWEESHLTPPSGRQARPDAVG